MPGTIQAATAILAANLTELAAGLAAGGAAEPAWVAEVLTVAADGVSIWLAEVFQHVLTRLLLVIPRVSLGPLCTPPRTCGGAATPFVSYMAC